MTNMSMLTCKRSMKKKKKKKMTQISDKVQWLSRTNIATVIFIFEIILSYTRLIGTQISN